MRECVEKQHEGYFMKYTRLYIIQHLYCKSNVYILDIHRKSFVIEKADFDCF